MENENLSQEPATPKIPNQINFGYQALASTQLNINYPTPILIIKSDGNLIWNKPDGTNITIENEKDLHLAFLALLKNKFSVEAVQILINALSAEDRAQLTDGYHSFESLYEIRKVYNVACFNAWYAMGYYDVHKSRYHNDGEVCFDGNWFIVSAMLPTGLISNHYHINDWDLFNCYEADTALYPFDGHTTQDVITRIKDIL